MASFTLLLLSGGGHTGRNVLAALGPRRHQIRLVTTTDVSDEPSLFDFDAAYLAPAISVDANGFARKFAHVLERERPALVIPCRDEDVAWLSHYARANPQAASTLLCGDATLGEAVNDKWLSAEFCRANDLPFVNTITAYDAAAQDAFIRSNGLPLVAKPRNGADARGIFIVTTPAQAHGALQRDGYVLQQFLGDPVQVKALRDDIEKIGIPLFYSLEGRKRSIQILIGPTGEIEHIICTVNEFVGRNARTISIDGSPEARRIGERCACVFAANGWRGPLNVQCQPDATGALKIHEFNARFTGATAARARLGFDEVGAAIRLFTGCEFPSLPTSGQTLSACESLAARGASADVASRFGETGVWHRDIALAARA